MSDSYEDLERKYPQFDPVVQMQVDEYTRSMRVATGATCAIGIVEVNEATQIAINSGGESEAEAQARSLVILIHAAAGAVEQKSQGEVKLMVQIDDKILPAAPEHLCAVMGVRPK